MGLVRPEAAGFDPMGSGLLIQDAPDAHRAISIASVQQEIECQRIA
jgi:hypothetical protein